MLSISTCIASLPLAVTSALSKIRAFVVPIKTAAPTAPASAVPPDEKLAAGSSMKISVSSPAWTLTDPSVSITPAEPMVASVVDFTKPTDTEPAPASPPEEPAIPTTVAVKFCSVSALTMTLSSALTVELMPACTSFQNTFAPSATPIEVELEAANVPVKSVMVVLSTAVTETACVLDVTVLSVLRSAPCWTSA